MPTVYIINQAAHDFSAAKQFGELEYLSSGSINRYHTNNITRLFYDKLKDSGPEDYLLLTSLTVMATIAGVIFTLLHGKLNLLLHVPKTNTYIERKLDLTFIKRK